MDIKLLSKKLLDDQEYAELINAIKLIENNEFQKLYNNYTNLLKELVCVQSYEDFMDFIGEETININIFILCFLTQKNKCIELGGYESDINKKIKQFICEKSNNNELLDRIKSLDEDVYTDYDGEDNFCKYVSELNDILKQYDLKIVVFFNDEYWACIYNLFLLDVLVGNIVINEWQDDDIEIII